MNINEKEITIYWKSGPYDWGLLLLAIVFIGTIFYTGLAEMVSKWENEEYSHAYILPLVLVFFLWQQKEHLARTSYSRSWLGIIVILAGIALYIFGELSSLFILIQYGFLITVLGLTLAMFGSKGLMLTWPVFVLIFFMIPLPNFFLNNLSAKLQLISSSLGVSFIRLFDISVYLEGNVIDLGKMKLQVVEACSGLRYLFPLMALGFIASLFYKAAFWKRAIVFLSTFPITVLMNSVRIGIIGVTVEYWGQTAAEGFLHDFEGWVIFVLCTLLLVFEMWILTKVGSDRKTLTETFMLEIKDDHIIPADAIKKRVLHTPIIAALILLAAATMMSFFVTNRTEEKPDREQFSQFPLQIHNWKGTFDTIESLYLNELKLNDYLMANYKSDTGEKINLYTAYYDSQRAGESAHSPRTCIPGGGWQIQELTQITLDSIPFKNTPLKVNRVLVQHGQYKQLVYYWFQQRGRNITNEYLVKWYLFWDSLTKKRTDGAMIRLTMPLSLNQDASHGDKILTSFIQNLTPILEKYIPE